jgi:hypothetical protein
MANPFAAVGRAFSALDRGFVWLATPFGVRVRDPRKRYPILLGVFALLHGLGSLNARWTPLVALGVGYIGVIAIGRAWVVNEKQRTDIAKKLKDGNPDDLPDLRWTALVSALQLLILFPLLFYQLQRHFDLFKVHDDATALSWFWFAIDKTYLKALPDWTVLYGVHITSIEIDSSWGRHAILLSRLTFDYILIQGLLRLLAIRTTIRVAVAVVKTDPDIAVRVGRRAIPALIRTLQDPDPKIRGAAANALTQLGETDAIAALGNAAKK